MNDINKEFEAPALSGIFMLLVIIAMFGLAIVMFAYARAPIMGITIGIIALFLSTGLYSLQPKEAIVLLLFGEYRGTDRETGLRWANPFYKGRRISVRARTLNGERLKVNDKRGNPIEIAAVVVWRVRDTAQASFDVDDFESYVMTQSESAVRHLASCYAYDEGEHQEVTLRGGTEEVTNTLREELERRFEKAGVVVDEARLAHLAYAPEIAGAMLRRQQAEAVLSARKKIVSGAVSMVEMALNELSEKHVVTLDDERKAAMVGNLMVILCSERDTQPIVNTGTLYT